MDTILIGKRVKVFNSFHSDSPVISEGFVVGVCQGSSGEVRLVVDVGSGKRFVVKDVTDTAPTGDWK